MASTCLARPLYPRYLPQLLRCRELAFCAICRPERVQQSQSRMISRSLEVNIKFASRQVGELPFVEGEFGCRPSSSMQEFCGNDYREVAVNTRQKTRRFNTSGNTASEQKLGECVCRWSV
jgi:hypothetical protein